MKKCDSCNIEFNTNENLCPLCQNILVGNSDEINFPSNIRYKTNSLILKILLFSSLTILLIFSFLEYILFKNLHISLYISLGLLTNYVIVYFILKNCNNIFKIFNKHGIIVICLLIIWYMVTKSKIITNYIIPSVCLFELLFNFVVSIILRKNYLVKYSTQILMNIILLFLPIILVLLKLTTNNILSYICSLSSIITILGLLIFFYDDIKDELRKIFNI